MYPMSNDMTKDVEYKTVEEITDLCTRENICADIIRKYLSDIYAYELFNYNRTGTMNIDSILQSYSIKPGVGMITRVLSPHRFVDGYFRSIDKLIKDLEELRKTNGDFNLDDYLIHTINNLCTLVEDYSTKKEFIQRKWKGWKYNEETDTEPESDETTEYNGSDDRSPD